MKKFWSFLAAVGFLTLALALFITNDRPLAQGQVGPINQVICNKTANLPVGSTGLTQMIAAVTGQTIFICGWHVTNTAASGTFLFAQGTGSNCGTGGITILPATNVTNAAPSADHIDYAVISTLPSAAFCINPSVNTISALIFYSQF